MNKIHLKKFISFYSAYKVDVLFRRIEKLTRLSTESRRAIRFRDVERHKE